MGSSSNVRMRRPGLPRPKARASEAPFQYQVTRTKNHSEEVIVAQRLGSARHAKASVL